MEEDGYKSIFQLKIGGHPNPTERRSVVVYFEKHVGLPKDRKRVKDKKNKKTKKQNRMWFQRFIFISSSTRPRMSGSPRIGGLRLLFHAVCGPRTPNSAFLRSWMSTFHPPPPLPLVQRLLPPIFLNFHLFPCDFALPYKPTWCYSLHSCCPSSSSLPSPTSSSACPRRSSPSCSGPSSPNPRSRLPLHLPRAESRSRRRCSGRRRRSCRL